MGLKSVTIKAAWITFLAIILAAIIAGVFGIFNKNQDVENDVQTIENQNSPKSINIQGNSNTINYHITDFNKELLKYYVEENKEDKTPDLIIEKILSEHSDSISKDLLTEYSKGVLNIYETLYENSLLNLNDTINSQFNEKSHVFDIAVNTTSLGHDILMVFKLLPLSHKAKYLDILDFIIALKDIKVAKGIIICNGGFSEDVVEFASKNNVDLCTFKDAQSRKWNENIEIPVVWIKSTPLMHVEFGVKLDAGDKIPGDFTELIFSYNEGEETFTIKDIISYKWDNNLIPHVTDSIHLISMKTSTLKMNTYNAGWKVMDQLDIYYTTREEYYLRFFIPEVYKAIENVITRDVQFTEIEIEFEIFDESDKWIKIGEDLKEDNSNGEDFNLPKGLLIVATATIDDLSIGEFNTDKFGIQKME